MIEEKKAVETVYKELFIRKSRRSKFVTRIARWDEGPLVLEKRQVVVDETTKEERVGRCRGLTGPELREVVKRWEEIEAVFLANDVHYKMKSDAGWTIGQVCK